jgi:RimJ/RimL family protein N-acetyltransferase
MSANTPLLECLDLRTIRLVPVREKHAEYIYSLRIDPVLNRHLSPPPPSAAAQAAWIGRYVEREQAGNEYYFLIERLDGIPCGTIRLYDFNPPAHPNSFCWGSWILDANKTRFAAIESALLVYELGFNRIGFAASHFDVRKGNTKVISFHEKFGARTTSDDEENVYMQLTRESFDAVKSNMLRLVMGHATPDAKP